MSGMRSAGVPIAALFCLMVTPPALAQAPSQAQQDAIRSNCRSDFLSLCSGVPRGGKEAFECLAKNQPRLSAACRSAVSAIAPAPAAAKPAETKPAEAKPASAPPAQAAPAAAPAAAPVASAPKPAPAKAAAPSIPAPAAPTAPKVTAKPAAAPKSAAAPIPPATPSVAPVATPAAVSPPAAAPAAPHQPRLGEAAIIRRFCVTDFKVLCKGVQIGGGRAIKCLSDNRPALSPGCRDAMATTGN